MSKKLLMNNCSENGLMPVMDGLVCWLDGRNYVAGENIWRDKSRNKNDFIANGLSKNGRSAVYCATESGYALRDFDTIENYTIELQCSFNSLNKKFYLWTTGDITIKENQDYFWSQADNIIRLTRSYNNNANHIHHNIMNGPQINKIYMFVITYDKDMKKSILYIDGVKISEFDMVHEHSNMNHNMLFNNSRLDRALTNGYIYDYKYYNRVLAEEEIQQNYLYEQSIKRGDE